MFASALLRQNVYDLCVFRMGGIALHRQEAGFAVARKRGSRTVSPDNSHLLSSYLVRLHLRRLSGVRSKVVAQRWSPLHTVCRTNAEFSHPRTCLVLFEVSGMFGIIWVFAATLFHACGGPASHLPEQTLLKMRLRPLYPGLAQPSATTRPMPVA